MVHRLMEMLVVSRNSIDAIEAIPAIVSEFITPEAENCRGEFEGQLTDVAGRIRGGGYPQENGVPQDILGTLLSADEVHCELPFCYRETTPDGPVVWNGIMDVVYRVGDEWHIVDYKTNADGTELDVRYAGQLSAYKAAFKAVIGEDAADAMTYHIDV